MQLRNFDLNLLTVFDAVFEEHSIAAASERLSVSQSAVSHALRRLRKSLSDELFVRRADGMWPTPKARQFAIPVKIALGRIARALGGEPFDPSQAIRSFAIGASDYALAHLRLVRRTLAQVSPPSHALILRLHDGGRRAAAGRFIGSVADSSQSIARRGPSQRTLSLTVGQFSFAREIVFGVS